MAKDMNCKTNNHRHILSQIYAHHIQAFVGYNIRIWAVYPCTSVYLYGTKFLFACFARQPHVRCCQTAMSGWWLSHPSDKYESQWEGLSIHIMENTEGTVIESNIEIPYHRIHITILQI